MKGEKMEKEIEGGCPSCIEVLKNLPKEALSKADGNGICPRCCAVTEGEPIKNGPMTILECLRIFLEAPACLKRGG
ncbi:MAG: hypothetical protein COS30_01030 [Candidatus Portnoybacteria bacterium CG02_land_8_20_14_3_00_45_8]|uniref:Uncharacterized protein n=1 Tax=Candidatus Portnoybacteria bacterium CG02_land_8_20_14_3_00_45_8 TaxID=1974807 RepID=A0A2M7D6H8_9BACT|nr:MAG: hypothetical protein COS30_01030 [Candidatus Portnoybacteria bacterium CG02_land_8_20_14_3_00_45_8]